ncbi:hypothetical protein tinsulaeT_21550 [Thalassotalea insulae]|uniref:Glycine zipper 2TM domain-containing protein n=1 Tax=Thalassotalea insulae TaxID=2056778 RepID=A0ABQ6GVT4_9GAMM|nr:hypothetical protein [Thalassotalea insulae]GLX78815.1 hypothetical protein tinsulaeT_21550 [Thalassotalea insulae]
MKRLLLPLLLLSGCATPGVDRAEQNHVVKEFYASVQSVKAVTLSSDVKTGVLVGAGVGVIDELDGNSEDMVAGGIAGALVGGLFTAIFEGSDEAFEYSLHNKEQGQFTLVQKEQITKNSQCVKVRVANKASISPVANSYCNS